MIRHSPATLQRLGIALVMLSSSGLRASTPAPAPDPLAGLTLPSVPADAPKLKLKALKPPREHEALVPRIATHHKRVALAATLYHEGNNPATRKPSDTGGQLAARWRQLAAHTRGVFVLRDALYSQQDHPFRHSPFAPLLPPSWVTLAAQHVADKRPIQPMRAPALDDDAAWRKLKLAEAFGSFPPQETLHAHATGKGAFARNARQTLRQLAAHTDALLAAAPHGPDAVARAGAARIAWSDRAYFGQKLRRDHVIPIFVEHPTAHEITEGKGMIPEGFKTTPALVRAVRNAIYRARLADGDLAIERYDLSRPKDRARAIKLLEDLIPPKDPSKRTARVWLWVTGPLDPKKKLAGEGPLRYTAAFVKEARAARIDMTRLELFGKPPVSPPRPTKRAPDARAKALKAAIAAHKRAGLSYVSVNLYPDQL